MSPFFLHTNVVRFCLACSFLLLGSSRSAHADAVDDAQRIAHNIRAARTNLEAAQNRLRDFTQLDESFRRKQLDHEISFTEARLASLRRRLAEYEPFEIWRRSAPMFSVLEDTRLSLLETEFHLDELRSLRGSLLQQRPAEQRRLLEAQVERAEQALRDAAAGK